MQAHVSNDSARSSDAVQQAARQPGALVAGRQPAAKQAHAAPVDISAAERSDSAFAVEALQPLEDLGPISDAQSGRSTALVRRPCAPPGPARPGTLLPCSSPPSSSAGRTASAPEQTQGGVSRGQGLPYRAINNGPPKPPCNRQRVSRLRELDVMDKPPDPEIGVKLRWCCLPLGLSASWSARDTLTLA